MKQINRQLFFVFLFFCFSDCKSQTIIQSSGNVTSNSTVTIPKRDYKEEIRYAIIANKFDRVKKLIENDADSIDFDYAIRYSYECDNPPILRYLLSHGKKIAINDSVVEVDDYDADFDCHKLMLKYEPSFREEISTYEFIETRLWFYLRAVQLNDYSALELIDFTDEALEHNSCEGETGLTIAVKENDIEMVKYLLSRGVNKEKREFPACFDDAQEGQNAYEIAVDLGFNEIVELLK